MSLSSLTINAVDQLKNTRAHDAFACVEHLPWAMLLDTCNNRLSDGRYDIIAYAPLASFQFADGQSKLSILNPKADFLREATLNHSPFDDLSKLHQLFSQSVDISEHQTSQLPFLIGALGLFAYDINTHTDRITDSHPDQYQLDDIAVGFYEQSLIFDNYTGEVYHISTSANDSEWLARIIGLTNTAVFKANMHAPFYLTQNWQANMSESEYHESMHKIDNYLRAGDCYQINFAQRFSAPYQGSEWQAYQHLTAVNKAPFSSFIRLPESCVLSVSPERFISVKDRKVVTKPIKGTRKRSDDPLLDKQLSDALLNSEKDKAENLMIVDLLRNDLSKHCKPHSVKVPHLFALESYPAVHHMVSTVTGELKDNSSPFDLLAGAFPGGSITGAPKVRAMQIIQELEPDKRSIYCGSIGYVGIRQDMDTNICIRTILAEKGTMHCWAGGGIVLDSQASDEYQESFHKVAKILPTLSATLRQQNNSSKKAS
ncbi:aminodeoxychorismate synthase component I [Glaciecola sp. SC05]|uniref:aminodeoxychorismate synthase component I n=1 Tax=Glaciecola sp. SC05 TaxID=1987355 RepID=UPI003529B0AB